MTTSVFRYVVRLLDVFIKWWWAVLTGVASIASWWAFPTGFSIGRVAGIFIIFSVLTLLFLTWSVLLQGFQWYVATETHPQIVAFIPRSADPAVSAGAMPTAPSGCSFLVREQGWRLTFGHIFGLYRSVEHNEEVCIGILRVDRGRFGDDCVQCTSVWIAPVHLKALQDDSELAKKLMIRREIPENTVAKIAQGQQ
jgi:hypothetical protein